MRSMGPRWVNIPNSSIGSGAIRFGRPAEIASVPRKIWTLLGKAREKNDAMAARKTRRGVGGKKQRNRHGERRVGDGALVSSTLSLGNVLPSTQSIPKWGGGQNRFSPTSSTVRDTQWSPRLKGKKLRVVTQGGKPRVRDPSEKASHRNGPK